MEHADTNFYTYRLDVALRFSMIEDPPLYQIISWFIDKSI